MSDGMSDEKSRAEVVERVRGAFARALDPGASENEARSALKLAFKRARADGVTLPELAGAMNEIDAAAIEQVIAERVHDAMVVYDQKEAAIREDLLRRGIERAYERGMTDAFAAAGGASPGVTAATIRAGAALRSAGVNLPFVPSTSDDDDPPGADPWWDSGGVSTGSRRRRNFEAKRGGRGR
jgi:hypothetical protein